MIIVPPSLDMIMTDILSGKVSKCLFGHFSRCPGVSRQAVCEAA
jgi:hypothetical protein